MMVLRRGLRPGTRCAVRLVRGRHPVTRCTSCRWGSCRSGPEGHRHRAGPEPIVGNARQRRRLPGVPGQL